MARRRQRRPGRFLSLLALALIVVGGINLWRRLPARGPIDRVETKTAQQDDLRIGSRKNIRKDPRRPSQQRYQQVAQLLLAPPIPNLGRVENQIGWSCGKALI